MLCMERENSLRIKENLGAGEFANVMTSNVRNNNGIIPAGVGEVSWKES